jgi:hypothetical protein
VGKKIYKILNDMGYFDKFRAENRVEMIIEILSRRLEAPSKVLQKKISSVQNLNKLGELVVFASICVSLEEFSTALK